MKIDLKITPRLKLAAELTPRCGCVCDIGTDHGYLPIYLIENGICERAVASDINEGPLRNAEKNIALFGKGGLIKTRLSDGFENIVEDEADCALICGMGGELEAEIIAGRKAKMTRFVIQPQRSFEFLRTFLARNGFEIKREGLAKEKNKMYCAFYAEYTGERREIGLGEALLGRRELAENKALFEEYVRYRMRAVDAALESIGGAGGEKNRGEKHENLGEININRGEKKRKLEEIKGIYMSVLGEKSAEGESGGV